MRNNRKNESFSTSAWETSSSAWGTSNEQTTQEAEVTASSNAFADVPSDGYIKYKALYEFSARNQDEITFQPGDIIMVTILFFDCFKK
jgi:intersectin